MKTSKAPEKIYIDDFGSELSSDWHTEHSYEKDIEYIRKDTFVEKVIDFIQKHIVEINYDYEMEKEDWIEDFKNYMKGE